MSKHLRHAAAHRRLLLKGLAALPLGLNFGQAQASIAEPDCELCFRHTHTDESLRIVYRSGGTYVPSALERIDWLMRDFRTGDVARIDPRLLDILHTLRTACGGESFEIISAFRSPTTNERLHKADGTGVATRSLHMDGRAIDVRIPGFDTAALRDAALALRAGGVGYYPDSDFVHLDTGRVRHWGA
ncbi:MAG: hypothetical protein AzoDbin1_00146 [Azoarcus sp.]|uniref:Murein endopeptidase K n=1 Tax=Aromatoleum tolulyticum TaxID=34027 RepID=A0A1N6U5G5_9RHOO|nr:DUF882 domain-containing protein [Aromatoleum tolulyticum]MCK9983674.1 hypothetical protein [Azoarcus sp.]SIQ60885.1 Uncharacterized conserved protein YcbK, DUF882 family [Aromatoleum tolulyticum]